MLLMLIPIFFVTLPLSMLINTFLGITALYAGNWNLESLYMLSIVLISLLLTVFIWLCINSKYLIARILGFSILLAGLALGIYILSSARPV
jgi:hypothetical protein